MLAVYPTVRGYAFVLFEGAENPFDWGVKEVRGIAKNVSIVNSVSRVIEQYHPDVLVLEDFRDRRCRRGSRIRSLYAALADMAVTAGVTVKLIGRAIVKERFSPAGARTKPEIAQVIARHIPAFKHRLPPLRKIWMSEDPRQSLFDAAALGLTHYFGEHGGIPEPRAMDIKE